MLTAQVRIYYVYAISRVYLQAGVMYQMHGRKYYPGGIVRPLAPIINLKAKHGSYAVCRAIISNQIPAMVKGCRKPARQPEPGVPHCLQSSQTGIVLTDNDLSL